MSRASFALHRPSVSRIVTAMEELVHEDITEEMRAFLAGKRMRIYEMRMHVVGDPSEDLTLDTHLSEVKGLFLHREYRAKNLRGEVVLFASARLVVTDLTKMVPVKVPASWVETPSNALLPPTDLRPKITNREGVEIACTLTDCAEHGFVHPRAYLAPILDRHPEKKLRTLDVTYEKDSPPGACTLVTEEKADAVAAYYLHAGEVVTHLRITWK